MPGTDIEDIWLFWSLVFVSQARTISDFNESWVWLCSVLKLDCEFVSEASLISRQKGCVIDLLVTL